MDRVKVVDLRLQGLRGEIWHVPMQMLRQRMLWVLQVIDDLLDHPLIEHPVGHLAIGVRYRLLLRLLSLILTLGLQLGWLR